MGRQYDISVLFKVIDRATGPLRNVGRNLGRLGPRVNRLRQRFNELAKSVKAAGQKMKDIGKDLSMKLTLPIAAFGALAVRSAISFQASMNMVGAVTKATSEEFIKLEKLAKKMGATTQFSASQAAEGMKFLGMAGLTVDQIMGALPRTLELAASAQIDLGTSADIVTNIMSGFRMETSELAKVNDILVNAFTSSNTDLQQLGEGMKVVGPVAKAMQFRFTETAAALGILAKNAFQGTLGGTGLRRIMTNLMSLTPKAGKAFAELGIKIFNADGSMRDITQVLASFEEVQAKGVDQMKIAQAVMEAFGQRGGPQFLALLGAGSKELANFEENLKEVGTSARVAESQMRRLPGAFKLLASSFEAVQLAFIDSGLGKWIEFVVRKVAVFLQKLSETNPKLLSVITIIGMLVAVIGPLLVGVGMLAIAIGAITLPIALVTAGVIALGGAAALLIAYWKPVKAFFVDLFTFISDKLGPIIDKARMITGAVTGKFKAAREWVKDDFRRLGNKLGLSSGAKEIASATGQMNKSETDINIRLIADEGTSASVEKVKRKKGDAAVRIASVGYVGAY